MWYEVGSNFIIFHVAIQIHLFKKAILGNSLVVRWLELCAFTAEGAGSIPGQGTKIPKATQHSQKEKKISYSFPIGWSLSPCGKLLTIDTWFYFRKC